jgi:outer membrane protein assembly factor BamE
MPTLPDLPDMPNILPDMSLPTLYKDDVQQGSVLTRFKINQLKTGMSKTQVQNLIGSPSITDPFHNNQWDYINHSTRHEKDDIHYRLILKFTNQKLTTIDTSGIASLAKLTDKEKALEDKRIAKEKAQKLAQEKARIAEEKRVAEEKRIIEEKRIAERMLAIKKAKAAELEKKIKLEYALQQEADRKKAAKAAELKKNQAKKLAEEQLEQKRIAEEEAAKADKAAKMAADKAKQEAADRAKQEAETPWYKFW